MFLSHDQLGVGGDNRSVDLLVSLLQPMVQGIVNQFAQLQNGGGSSSDDLKIRMVGPRTNEKLALAPSASRDDLPPQALAPSASRDNLPPEISAGVSPLRETVVASARRE